MANGPYYSFMVGLPYHRIILDNLDQFEIESLSIVHTDAIACVAFRSSVIGWNLHNRCDSRTFDRTKLNMFNPCDPGRNCCCMYGCTCSCSCMFVYTVWSSRRSVARPIAAIDRRDDRVSVYTVRSSRRSPRVNTVLFVERMMLMANKGWHQMWEG